MFLVLSVLLVLGQTLASIPLADDYAFLKELDSFATYVVIVRDEGNAEKAEISRKELLETPLDSEVNQAVLSIRSATLLSRLYVEQETPNSKRAKALLEEAEESLSFLKNYPYFLLMGEAEIDSIYYLITPSRLGKGISSNAKIKKANEQYPNQIYALLMKANSLLYAPPFAGGNKEEALSLFLKLLEEGSPLLSRWDRASIYTGIGRVCMEREEWEQALGYFKAAKTLYAFDPTLDAYIKETQEQL
ncbi:MAG: hypothetical protein ACQ5SW_06810 [Sphaerochaetaceae bacterium]